MTNEKLRKIALDSKDPKIVRLAASVERWRAAASGYTEDTAAWVDKWLKLKEEK